MMKHLSCEEFCKVLLSERHITIEQTELFWQKVIIGSTKSFKCRLIVFSSD